MLAEEIFARPGVARMEIEMRKVLILAAGLTIAATSAWSQSSSRDRDDNRRFDHRDWRESHGWDRGPDLRRGRIGPDDDRDDDEGDGGGARFFLRSGDTQLRVVCSDRETMRACVDAALMMFDRMQSQRGGTSQSQQGGTSRQDTPSRQSSPPSSGSQPLYQ